MRTDHAIIEQSVCASIPIRLDSASFTLRGVISDVMNQMEAFRILASADRQLVLYELVERDETLSIEELSQQVAARRHRISPQKISDTKIERAYVRLVHDSLPRLQDTEIINVNWAGSEVSLSSKPEVDQLFDAAEELESWPPDDLLEDPSSSA